MGIKFIFVVLGLIVAQKVEGSHILFIHSCVSYSHRVSTLPLVEELVARGHEVTFIGPYHSKTPIKNVTDIIPKRLSAFIEEVIDANFDVTHRAYGLTPKFIMVYDYICYEACTHVLQSEEIQEWLKTNPKVDLIFADTGPECSYGFAQWLQAKHAITLPVTFISKFFEPYGVPPESSAVPDWDVSFRPPLTFLGRAVGTVIPLIWRLSQLVWYPWYRSLFQNHLGLTNVPDLDEFQKNTSLILINGDFIEDYPRAYPPMVVKLPGLHVKARNGRGNSPVNQELETFITSKTANGTPSKGFFYISFGTVARAPNLPINIRETFFKAIEAYPDIKFIWRWDGPSPDNFPKNLLLKRWVEQEDLLGHPKIMGVITQAGRPTMLEAFYNGVPTITFPILAEQDFNAHRFEMLGISISLDIVGISEEALKNAISELAHNTTYAERTKELARFARDSQNSPLESAVWWTEYILRNSQENLSLLKPLSQNVSWYKKRDLDVWAVFLLLFYLWAKITLWFFKRLIKKCCSGKESKPPPKKVKSS